MAQWRWGHCTWRLERYLTSCGLIGRIRSPCINGGRESACVCTYCSGITDDIHDRCSGEWTVLELRTPQGVSIALRIEGTGSARLSPFHEHPKIPTKYFATIDKSKGRSTRRAIKVPWMHGVRRVLIVSMYGHVTILGHKFFIASSPKVGWERVNSNGGKKPVLSTRCAQAEVSSVCILTNLESLVPGVQVNVSPKSSCRWYLLQVIYSDVNMCVSFHLARSGPV